MHSRLLGRTLTLHHLPPTRHMYHRRAKLLGPEGALLHSAGSKVSPMGSTGRLSDPFLLLTSLPKYLHTLLCVSIPAASCEDYPGTQWVLSPFFNEQKIKQCLCNIPTFLSGYLNYHPNRTFVIFNLNYFRSFLIGSPSSLMMKPSSTLLSTYFS